MTAATIPTTLAAPELDAETLAALDQAEYDARFAEIVYGSETPRLWTRPLRDVDSDSAATLGFLVCDFATEVLEVDLLPWQRWWFRHALELRPDGKLRFSTILTLISRQNGKTFLLKILALYFLFVRRVRLILGVAQAREISKESMIGAHEIAAEIAELAAEFVPNSRGVDGMHSAPGGEEFRLLRIKDPLTGKTLAPMRRYKIAALGKKAGRSLSVDVLILDEFRHMTTLGWGALSKTTNARPESLTLAISNAGDDESAVMNNLRDAILAGADSTAGIFEWSAPEETRCTCTPGDRLAARGWHKPDCLLIDQRTWAQANPSYNYKIMPKTLRKDCALDPVEVFLTECLCVRVQHMETLFERAAWEQHVAPVAFKPNSERIGVVFDMSPDLAHASLVAAVHDRETGRTRLAVVKAWSGPDVRLVDTELPEILARLRARRFAWFPNGPAGAKGTLLRGLPRSREINNVAEACQEFVDAVAGGQIQHPGDPLLTAQVLDAKKVDTGDGFRFVRRGVGHVDSVYAAAGAVRLAREMTKSRGVSVA